MTAPADRTEPRRSHSILNSERRRMRDLLASGMSIGRIAKTVGVTRETVLRHVADQPLARFNALAWEAARVERFYAACNRALAAAPHAHGGHP